MSVIADQLKSKGEYEAHLADGRLEHSKKFCRSQGLCDDASLHENTTVADAEKWCDSKYGHEAWTSILAPKPDTEYTSSQIGMQLCASGRLHCEAVFCKEYVCKNTDSQDIEGLLRSLNWKNQSHPEVVLETMAWAHKKL